MRKNLRTIFAATAAGGLAAFGAYQTKIHQDELLHYAVIRDYSAIVPLLAAGVSQDVKDEELLGATGLNFPQTAKALLEQGARGHEEHLITASFNGDIEMVRTFLDQGVSVDAFKGGALLCAAGEGHTTIVKLLLDRGADPSLQNNVALREAEKYGHIAAAELIRARLHTIQAKAVSTASLSKRTFRA